jgi:uncharacterized protein YciI
MKQYFFLLALYFSIAPVFAQDTLTIVFLNKNPSASQMSKDEVDKIMAGHAENREKLAKEGKLLVAGPFDGGGGVYIMKTGSVEEAKAWISNDPGVRAERWTIEILPYKPRVGGICPVGEKYTMTNYTFVRFDAIVSKATAQTFPELMRQHDEYLNTIVKSGNVVTEAVFGDNHGGILVLKGDVKKELIESDPAIQQGLIEFHFKKFYTAKGSFCEE